MADTVTSEELQQHLEELAEGLGLSVKELLSKYTTTEVLNGELDAIRLDIKKITEVGDLDSESIAEKIIKINEVIGDASDDVVKSLFDRISANESAIEATTAALEAHKEDYKTGQEAQDKKIAAANDGLGALDKVVTDNKTAQASVNDATAKTLGEQTAKLDTLGGDVDTEGSVANTVAGAVAEEAKRTNVIKENLESAIGDVDTKVEETKTMAQEAKDAADEAKSNVEAAVTKADEAKTAGEAATAAAETATATAVEVKGKVDTINAALEDTTDEDDNLVKGMKTRLSDVEAAAKAEKEAREGDVINIYNKIEELDGSGLAKGVICGKKAANKFNAIFDLDPFEECSDDDDL